MRAVITAGGTAGHINPALAIADEIKENEPDSVILFIGRKDGMEKRLVTQRGYELKEIEVHGFMRELSIKSLIFNIKSIYRVVTAGMAARRIFKTFMPDIVIGCGGYVSGPVVRTASKMHIRTAIQEQNSFPGVTTRLLVRRADLIFAPDNEGAVRIGYKDKVIISGNPINKEFFISNREYLRKKWNVKDKSFILSYGGSNGSVGINRIAAALMEKYKNSDKVFHVHVTGNFAKNSFSTLMDEYGIEPEKISHIKVFEYIDEMPLFYSASDLIISRSGALTIAEIKASGKASVLIPSPNVTENHQFYNALSLVKADAALLFEESNMDEKEIISKISELIEDKDKLKTMGKNAKTLQSEDAASIIYLNIRKLIDGV